MFSTFPDGAPGFGLLILRVALAVTVLICGAGYLSEPSDPAFFNWLSGFMFVAAAVFLTIGFLTPPVALLALAGGILWLLSARTSTFIEIYGVILAAATALLGPGAYSLDARLFGRREIVIPKDARGE